MKMPSKTILSGITPSGKLHIGNYFGAMHQHLTMQKQGNAFYFIANYHALTALNDGPLVYQNTVDIAIDYLALGLDPKGCTFFAQSDVPQVTELAWMLGTLCPVSLMEKGVAYKDKVANGLSPNIGLFTYPILQAADILIYHADLVPVGADQKQNIEFARDLAQKMNNTYGEDLLVLPEPYILEQVAVVPGTDGRKMSKSYHNTIGIFDEGKTLKDKVMSIQTDSTALEDPKNPDTCNVFKLIKLFAEPQLTLEIANNYRAGGYGYGHAKKALLELIQAYFEPARARRKALVNDLGYVHELLAFGGEKAREQAEHVMQPIRKALGIVHHHRIVNA
jgi:tryptophanyl-tRNA synthetase